VLNLFDMRDGWKYRIYCRHFKKNVKIFKNMHFSPDIAIFLRSIKHHRKAHQPRPYFPLLVLRTSEPDTGILGIRRSRFLYAALSHARRLRNK
jgi:hypothetical protein